MANIEGPIHYHDTEPCLHVTHVISSLDIDCIDNVCPLRMT